MGFTTFIVIDSFETRRKVVGGADNEITDTFFKNLMLKWIFPWKSEDLGSIPSETLKVLGLDNLDEEGLAHEDGMTELQAFNLPGKPLMITAESISGADHIIVYSLDPTLKEDADEFELPLNPDVNDNGNNKIHKLDGGVLDTANAGLEWVILKDDGTATLDPLSPLPPEVGFGTHPFDVPPRTLRFQPFLLFRRKHIA